MTTSKDDGGVLAATLIQIAAHAERITSLDTREAGHHDDLAAQIGELSRQLTSTGSRMDAVTEILGHHAAVVNALGPLDRQVSAIAGQLRELAASDDAHSGDQYPPVPPPRWWQLEDAEREAAADRLRAWVDQIYRPGYGHLAAALPPCWEHHPLCLYTIDWLSELWSALYLGATRPASAVAAQAEWQTRLLPAAADQMTTEARGCGHNTRRPAQAPPIHLKTNPGRR